MKLTLKVVSWMILGVIVIGAIHGWIGIRTEIRRFHEDVERDAARLGTALREQLIVVWQNDDSEGVLKLVKSAEGGRVHGTIRWVWFDAEANESFRPRVPHDQLNAIVLNQIHTVSWVDTDGEDYMNSYFPIQVAGERMGGLEISSSTKPLDQAKRDEIIETLSRVTSAVALICLLSAVLGIRMVGQPLKQLVLATRRIGDGDWSTRIKLRGRDELSELAESFNHMCGVLQETQEKQAKAMQQLQHAERLHTVGRLASGVAHELGTPLNVVSGRAGLIASGKISPEEVVDSANTIRAETERMTTIIRDLLDFARPKPPHRSEANLVEIVQQTVNVLGPLGKKRNIQLELVSPGTPFVAHVDVHQIQQVVTNLIVNAAQAMPNGGRIQVGFHFESRAPKTENAEPPRRYVCFYVDDEGTGISAEVRDHIFEPFFTTKEVGHGTGLGLSISYGIVQEHGGWIDVESQPGKGSRFVVYLPEEAVDAGSSSDR